VTIGIYCIENLVNGKKYIGQSVNVERRIRKHKSALLGNYCNNAYLQRAHDKHGVESFSFYILEVCNYDALDERERRYIYFYKTGEIEFGYNLEGGGNRGKFISDETRQKMSEVHIGKTLPREQVEKMVESRRGYKHTEETKRKIGAGNVGKKRSGETIKKMSLLFKGKILSLETRSKMSLAQKSRRLSEEIERQIPTEKKVDKHTEESKMLDEN